MSRFADREDIGRDGLYERYFMDLPKEAVFECFDLIEEEYELPSGLLRPEDKLMKLFAPVDTKNPLRWLVYQVREGDSQTEITSELAKRQQRYGTNEAWVQAGVETVADLIRAWCGKRPT